MVEVSTKLIEWNDTAQNWEDPLDLQGKIVNAGTDKAENMTSSKPMNFKNNQAYYYLLFDLWYMNPESILQVSILKQIGIHSIEVKVHIDQILDFNVNWVDPDSDKFLPRKYHGAWVTFNHNIWTFGGLGPDIKNQSKVLDKLSYYDDSNNKWVTVESESKAVPSPRYGNQMFCYYNYLIMFGGRDENGTYFGDLWVFDIIRSYWHKLLDSPTGYEIEEGSEEKTPINRAFFGGEMLIKYGSAIIFGGFGDEDTTFWDIWSLDVEKAVSVVEDPKKETSENLWKRFPVSRRDKNMLCRYGLDTINLDDTNVLIYGGATSEDSKQTLLFNVWSGKVTPLKDTNAAPSNRFYHGMIDSGNGVALMYGGIDDNGVILSEYWMFKVDTTANLISYVPYKPKSSYFSMIFAWREGFSLHYSASLDHPIIIGGGFGNNQQGKALLSLPTIYWENKELFEKGECTPCPKNSYFNRKLGHCEWCTIEQFFFEDKNDYFNSKCKFWPPGTIGSQSGKCTSCQPGSIYDPEIKGSCRVCSDEYFCPFATKNAFDKKEILENFDAIQYSNSPQMFKANVSPFDNTTMWVLLSMAFCFLTIFPLLFWMTMFRPTRKYSIKILKEIDLNPITGGEKRLVVGGAISLFYCIVLICWSCGIIAKYFLFNERVEATELSNISNQNNLPESYVVNITVILVFIL
jgi:hypothetical protein